MKVQLTAQNKAYYDVLFQEMVRYCKEDANITVPEEITSLGTYYAQLDKIRGKEHYDLFRLPVEEVEGYFDIDLDSRKITVPGKNERMGRTASFLENGLGVQGDHAAEIIYFRCARYFDTMDLSLCKANEGNIQGAIWIQWKRKGDLVPHLSLAYNVDLHHVKEVTATGEEIDKEELIFGWVLGDEATSIDGDLEFSVRFVQWDVTDPENRYVHFDQGEAPKALCFSLSTLTAKCKIHASLSAEYESGQIQIESSLNTLAANRPIYSGIYETAFGAYPVFLSDGNLNRTADLVEVEDGKGEYKYIIKAYSPDQGTLDIAWYQDVYGDEEASVRVTDSNVLKTTPPQAGSNTYTFEFTAKQAGSYYAVVSNKKGENSVRTITSNGSIIPHASEFTINENQLPIEKHDFSNRTGVQLVVAAENANGADAGVTSNSLNGVDYQWYIRNANYDGSYDAAEKIEGATAGTYVPTATTDGLVYCEIANRRNGNKVTKTSSTIALRPMPTIPEATMTYNEELDQLELQFAEGTDLRDLTFLWQEFPASSIISTENSFAPWKQGSNPKEVICSITRSYWGEEASESILGQVANLRPVQ